MRIALLAHGSRGDIQPMVAVAHALQERGHRVRITVNSNLAAWASQAGLEVVSMEPDIETFLRSGVGQSMLANGRIPAFFRALADLEREHDLDIRRACLEASEDADLLLSTVMTAFRAMSIAEALDRPHLVLSTMPMYPTARFASNLSPIHDLRLGALNRLSWHLYFSLYWLGQRDMLNGSRRALGLPAWSRRPRPEDQPHIHMYAADVAPLPDDLPQRIWQSGFATLSAGLRGRLGEAEPPAGLVDWLDAGEPPVFFGFGSMPVLDPAKLLSTVVSLCRQLGLRALIGAGWSRFGDEVPDELVFMAPSFDHDRFLPRCRATVHHGGAGTTHACLRAGRPTLITPIFADQPFWGQRVRALGVGDSFPFQRLGERQLARALQAVLRDDNVAQRAAALGKRLRAQDGTGLTADLVERFAAA